MVVQERGAIASDPSPVIPRCITHAPQHRWTPSSTGGRQYPLVLADPAPFLPYAYGIFDVTVGPVSLGRDCELVAPSLLSLSTVSQHRRSGVISVFAGAEAYAGSHAMVHSSGNVSVSAVVLDGGGRVASAPPDRDGSRDGGSPSVGSTGMSDLPRYE